MDKKSQSAPENTSVSKVTQSDFIPILVHQLRSSLATVRLAHETLLENKKHNLTDKQIHILKQAQLRTNRMLYLTDDLLEPNTVAASVLDIVLKPGNVETLLDETLEEFSVRLVDKDLKLTRHYGEHQSLVRFDYEKLQDAVRNLFDNAVKYTPKEGQITIETTYNKERVTIAIGDTGIGVPDEQVSKLFTKFLRMDNAKFMDQHGLGLGLYIVRRVVEEHGGTLQYEKNQPHGSVFIMSIPL